MLHALPHCSNMGPRKRRKVVQASREACLAEEEEPWRPGPGHSVEEQCDPCLPEDGALAGDDPWQDSAAVSSSSDHGQLCSRGGSFKCRGRLDCWVLPRMTQIAGTSQAMRRMVATLRR